ncbi:selenocysteine-specific translation elongation factor [Helicobacter sp. 12S02634-8]|uniref:selenocysteine-specific translation elongation factor n=1 Tax=Helicobacter sp. 12S02634-8 TaxID=1476199 RepID=UPI000BA7AAA9|nr:selenocysteine-specific translation elongation factor [Helicobacter sp. 12S02634-8]PAF47478.1 selenocysteine-specific translation elongation factor [Helicobacter sp. 12S02634-8]
MQNDLIIGLGGHIDHGKTSLIKALNGFDGDEKPEEKQRGITLDISFSHLYLPPKQTEDKTENKNARNIALIDVPGHDKLIKNMIAGSFGIDALLLVVGANEGLKPQSIEHLQIADMLAIPLAIVVITKIDLQNTPSVLAKLQNDIQKEFEKLHHIKLFAISPFSVYEPATHAKLIDLLYALPKVQRPLAPFFRYYIDRAFSITGAGTITTGSVLSGTMNKNDSVYICELDTQAGIKSIENHHTFIDTATPSHRIALNLKGVSASVLKRGYLLSQKGYIRGFDEIDVVIYPLVEMSLHNLVVQFFIGTKRCNAKISSLQPLLELAQKSHTPQPNRPYILASLKTDEKIFSIFGERFILRIQDKTIGGGEVLNPITEVMKKKQKYTYCNFLLQRDFKSAFYFCACVHKKGFGLISSAQRFSLTQKEAIQIAQNIPDIYLDTQELVIYHPQTFENIKDDILKTFSKNKNALLSSHSIHQKLKWASINLIQKALDSLEYEGFISKKDNLYLSKQNNIKNIDEYLQDTLYQTILSQGLTPLAPYNIYDMLAIDTKSADKALKALCGNKKLIRLQHNLFIAQSILKSLHTQMREWIQTYGYIDMGVLKNHLPLSRKYLIAYLDSLDAFDDIQNTQGKRTFKYKGKVCD